MLYFISDLSLSISSVYSNKILRLVLFNHGRWTSLNYKLHFNIIKETIKYWESEYWGCSESPNNAKLLHEESGEIKKVPGWIKWVRIDVCLTMGRKRNSKKESQGQSVPFPQPSPLPPFHLSHPRALLFLSSASPKLREAGDTQRQQTYKNSRKCFRAPKHKLPTGWTSERWQPAQRSLCQTRETRRNPLESLKYFLRD